MSEEKTLLDRLIDPLPAALWTAAGAILAQLWRRYRERMVTLRWQALHQPIAISTQDALFGTVEVRYNGNPVQNLFFSTIDVQNESNSDLTNLDLNLVFNDGTVIYISHGAVQGSANMLPFAESFAADLDRFVGSQPDDPQRPLLAATLSRRRDYRVPSLNRGASLQIGMLVQAQPGRQPIIQLASDHSGLKLIFQGPRHLLFGVDQNIATLTGLLAGIVIIAAISATPLGRGAAMAVGFGVGCVTAVLGALLVRAFRWFHRLLG